MKPIILTIILSFSIGSLHADINWILKKNQEGIKVYAASVPNSNVKAVKAECVINGSMTQLAALLLDTKAHEEWVYCTKISYLVRSISSQEQVYYSEMNVPWPLTNRDVVIALKLTQDPVTRILTVSAEAVPGYVPEKTNLVRVLVSKASWTVTPTGKDRLSIEYIAQLDPGGSVPSWAVNMFSAKGPFETFRKLRAIMLSGRYKDAHLDLIRD